MVGARYRQTLVSIVLGLSVVGSWSSGVLSLSSSGSILLGLNVVLVIGLVLVLRGELRGGLLKEIHCCGIVCLVKLKRVYRDRDMERRKILKMRGEEGYWEPL